MEPIVLPNRTQPVLSCLVLTLAKQQMGTSHEENFGYLLRSVRLHNCQPFYTCSRYSCSSCLSQMLLPTNCYFLYDRRIHSSCQSWLSFKLNLELAGCQRNQVEILLMARMGSMAIALKYNIKNIQNDIRKIQAHNWGSLMLAPIMGQLTPATSSYNSDMVTRPSLSCRDSVITVQS